VDSNNRYLLIIACSQRKRSDTGLLPAIERYDGGNYRLLRKAKREGYWPESLDVLILSAKYGLIQASTPIANYEQRMSRERARELKAQIMQSLLRYAQQNAYYEVYVDLGQDYIFTVAGIEKLFNNSLVNYAKGRIGERLSQLKTWIVEKCKET
jgi:cytoplasmic iron level regulating protein YaaA (DUF328/UPF0246 family)